MRSILRPLRNPIATAVFAMTLLCSLWWVSTREAHGSTVGRRVSVFIRYHVLSRWNGGRVRLGASSNWWLIGTSWVNDQGEWKLFDPDSDAFGGEPMPAHFRSLPRVGVSMEGGREFAGLYAITRDQEAVRVRMRHEAGPPPSRSELASLRATYVASKDWMSRPFSEIDDRALDRLGRDDVVIVHRRYWSGYAHDAAVVVGLVALLYSARFTCSPAWWRSRRRERRAARGECPRCRYAIAGLAERKCPECGEEWA